MITTVTEGNQVTIPAELAKALSIQPGTRIEWSIGNGRVLIGKVLPSRGELARQLLGVGKAWLAEGEDPVADLIREREEEDRIEGLE
jgi:AbrB family looped-hinge helix DNA binding protein